MNVWIFTYIVPVLVFLIGTILIGYKELRVYKKLITVMIIFGLIYTAISEPVAESWRVWVFNTKYVLGITFLGAQIETYIGFVFVVVIVTLVTLLCAEMEDKRLPLIATTLNIIKKKLKFNT